MIFFVCDEETGLLYKSFESLPEAEAARDRLNSTCKDPWHFIIREYDWDLILADLRHYFLQCWKDSVKEGKKEKP